MKSATTQYFSATIANGLLLAFGCGIGWYSPALPLLQSQQTPLETGPLSVEDLSWIGASTSIGAISGNIFVGYLITFTGSKYSILLLGFPQLASWLIMMFGTCPFHLMFSRYFTGFVGGGTQVCSSMFIAEIADNNLRGRLGTIYSYSRGFGVLFAYILGSHFDYIAASMVYTGITVLFFVSFILIPSTPQYLLQKNQNEAAEKSFNFYNKHKLQSDRSIQFESLKKMANEVKSEPKITLKDIVEARFAILQAGILGLLSVLCAQFLFLTYGSDIIEKSGTHLSSEVSSVSMAVVQILATFVAYMLIDSKGRKFLMVTSMFGCTLGHAIMIGYLYLYNNGVDTSMFHWTPIIGMLLVMFASSFGVIPLVQIYMAEIFPTKTRSFGLSFGNLTANVFFFITNKTYPILAVKIGLEGCLLIFCVSCALGTIYSLFYVNETKGKELNTIQDVKITE